MKKMCILFTVIAFCTVFTVPQQVFADTGETLMIALSAATVLFVGTIIFNIINVAVHTSEAPIDNRIADITISNKEITNDPEENQNYRLGKNFSLGTYSNRIDTRSGFFEIKF